MRGHGKKSWVGTLEFYIFSHLLGCSVEVYELVVWRDCPPEYERQSVTCAGQSHSVARLLYQDDGRTKHYDLIEGAPRPHLLASLPDDHPRIVQFFRRHRPLAERPAECRAVAECRIDDAARRQAGRVAERIATCVTERIAERVAERVA